MSTDRLRSLIGVWRDDPNGTYRSWFLWEERLKNFRSIRRGLMTVVQEIEVGTFGNHNREFSLEIVVKSIPWTVGCSKMEQVRRGRAEALDVPESRSPVARRTSSSPWQHTHTSRRRPNARRLSRLS